MVGVAGRDIPKLSFGPLSSRKPLLPEKSKLSLKIFPEHSPTIDSEPLRCFNQAVPVHKKKPSIKGLFLWWVWLGSNQRPLRCQRSAHTTELHTRNGVFNTLKDFRNQVLCFLFLEKLANI